MADLEGEQMSDSFQHAVSHVLRKEAGFVNDPAGGPTNRGVTQRYLDTSRAKYPDMNLPATVEELTVDQTVELYRRNEWTEIHGDALPSPIALALLDFAVNSGAIEAIRTLQRAMGLTIDGVLGPQTAAAATRPGAVNALCTERILFMSTLANWPANRKGWVSRVIDTAVEAFQ
jgi:lysozyme family protein